MVGRVALMSGCAILLATMAPTGGARADPAATPQPSQAQPTGSQAAPTAVSPLIVTAPEKPQIVRRKVDTFVKGITQQSAFEDNVPRWRTPICPVVAGFTPPQGEFLFNRLLQVGAAAGAPLAPPKCDPNLLIVATDHPDQLMAGLLKSAHGVFGDSGPSAINRFVRTSRPVRVWYNDVPIDRDGGSVSSDAPSAAVQGSGGGSIIQGVPTTTTYGGSSRLVSATSRGLALTYVIIDSNRLKGVSIGAVADYVSMIALAEVDQDADMSDASTILRLFSAPAADAPTSLSDWDSAFLYALYHTDPNSKLQRSRIASDSASEVTGPHAAAN